MGLAGQSAWRLPGSDVAGIVHAPGPYCYRCPYEKTYPSCDLVCARDLEDVIQTSTSGKIAAFLAEPIQGLGGFITPPKEYFQIAVEIVRKYGGVFICDEVQTGFGRTGTKMFGIEHYGVEPEIMTVAKSLANGTPVGATIAVPEVADSLKGFTISTFGGNAVSMTAAGATLDVIIGEDLAQNAPGDRGLFQGASGGVEGEISPHRGRPRDGSHPGHRACRGWKKTGPGGDQSAL